ncbi:autotransporter assembly complex protein TamA [Caldimonas thermodepolymerans]|uniref:autotransporter assembly complex protein TamA n=1 Tax=Caldimonas thermodepolymerans TaxID=215580 RepID=UPI0022369107|nr:BamA/TamA family outer membrane protein [Caldimonas thermodepolymerans]UZG43486.1 BamA/TamA family outer membrane protein [Caldimonas thermodepolymerans]
MIRLARASWTRLCHGTWLGLLAVALAAAPARAQDAGDAAPPPAEAASAAEPEPEAAGTSYRLRIQAPSAELRDLLRRHLDLSRFRQERDITEAEVGRLMSAAPAQARALLETEGYFAAQVSITREPSAEAGRQPLIILKVDPGPRAEVDRLTVEIQGHLQEAADAGDQGAARRIRFLRARWPLQPGSVFTQDAWTTAKNALLASLRARGYPTASYAGTSAQVDPKTHKVRIFVVADSGPLFRVGDIRVEGVERTTEQAVRNLAPFQRGEVFTEKMLLDYQENLQKSGLYDGVAVELDPDVEQADAAPIIVRVRETQTKSATVSIGFSSNTGPRTGLQFTHRRPFGHDWVASTRLLYGRDERVAALDLLSYPKPKGYRNLMSLSTEYLAAGGAETSTQRVRYGRTQDTERLDRLYYGEFNRTEVRTDTTERIDRALWANYEWTRRDVNNVLFPTRGLILSAHGGAGVSYDADDDRGPFVRAYLRATWYQPLGQRRILQLRGEAGQVFKREGLGVPDTLLFRAGGDDSVRGYGYRTLGPERDGAVVGGPVLATASAELMWPLMEGLRDWYGAVFVDAGNAARNWRDYEPAYGVGFGVRWRSPIGPLKADIAYGEAQRNIRLHLSVGVSF